MKLLRTAIALLTLLLVFSLAACKPGGDEEPNGNEQSGLPSAQQLIDGAKDALADAETYKFEMDMNIGMSAEAEGESYSMDMGMSMNGAADKTNERLHGDMAINMSMPGLGILDDSDDMSMAMEIYVIDEMMYVNANMPEMGDISMWIKSEVPDGMASAQMFEVNDYMGLLETADINIAGSDTIHGIKCHRVEVTPDIEELWELMMQEAATTEQGLPDMADDVLKELLDDFSVKYWFAQDTYFLIKAEIIMDVELTAEALGYPEEEGSMTMDMSINILIYDYNKPVSIELPPEAENAIEVSPDEMPFSF